MTRRKYAIVGTGARCRMFLDPIVDRFKENAKLVAVCDSSPTRIKFHLTRIREENGIEDIAAYEPADFERMIHECRPDVVIVCTPDHLHHEYIERALNQNVDVISEKPLTTDAAKCRAIFEAVRRSGKNVRTTFNARWIPGPTKVREVIAAGTIGRIKQVHFEYMLNTSHGADYFRRWHSRKECSGGLLVHKSTHHFDLINWWIDAIPSLVFAQGQLAFYGKENAIARGQEALTRYDRYTGSAEAEADPFRLSLSENARLTDLYLKAEGEGGYIRDRNVFRDGIDIEDSMSVMIRYRTGEIATYSLNAFCPIEGMNVAITGEGGRIDYQERKAPHILDGGKKVEANPDDFSMHLRVTPLFCRGYDIPVFAKAGNHGGSDKLIQEQIFSANPPAENLGRNAGHEQGAASLLVGVAANESMASGLAVVTDDLLALPPAARSFSELI